MNHPSANAVAERFWSKVDKSGECWIWTGARNSKGYGKFFPIASSRKFTAAHRAAWWLTNNPIPDGMLACHRCDNRACVNPTHLFLGTGRDNIHDMVSKGRHSRRLTAEQAKDAIARHAGGETQTAIARSYGVSSSTISLICLGKIWRHLGARPRPRRAARTDNLLERSMALIASVDSSDARALCAEIEALLRGDLAAELAKVAR